MINEKNSNSNSQEIQCMPPELSVLAENVAQDHVIQVEEIL